MQQCAKIFNFFVLMCRTRKKHKIKARSLKFAHKCHTHHFSLCISRKWKLKKETLKSINELIDLVFPNKIIFFFIKRERKKIQFRSILKEERKKTHRNELKRNSKLIVFYRHFIDYYTHKARAWVRERVKKFIYFSVFVVGKSGREKKMKFNYD